MSNQRETTKKGEKFTSLQFSTQSQYTTYEIKENKHNKKH